MEDVFQLRNARDFLKKLNYQYNIFLQDVSNEYEALNVVRDAYHIREWIYKESKNTSEEIFNKRIKEEYSKFTGYDFELLNEICNNSKHFEDKHNKNIDKSRIIGGFDPKGFSSGFDICRIIIHLFNGKQIEINDLLEKSVNFWNTYFSK